MAALTVPDKVPHLRASFGDERRRQDAA